jgi:molybdopterin synthase sulfur carrier subunit
MVKVLYFARLKESLKYSIEELELPADVKDVAALKRHLASRGGVWQDVFTGKQLVRGAINHALVADDARINDGDEVAFFPPVTGG